MESNNQTPRLNAMTFNIRNWERSDAHLQRIKTVIGIYTPDVIGFQEMSNNPQYEWVDRLMADVNISAMYGYIGQSREDDTGEQCAVFYRKDRLAVVESGTRWLYCQHGIHCTSSECKGETKAGRLADSIPYNRIFTYAKFRQFADQKEFVFINTHLEGAIIYEDIPVQVKQVEYLLNFAQDYIDDGDTIIMTGDFNARITSEPCVRILNAGYKQAESEAKNTVGEELPSDARYESQHKGMAKMIDHIFVHSKNCSFDTYTFCDQKYAVNGVEDYPSDHIPRMATLRLG